MPRLQELCVHAHIVIEMLHELLSTMKSREVLSSLVLTAQDTDHPASGTDDAETECDSEAKSDPELESEVLDFVQSAVKQLRGVIDEVHIDFFCTCCSYVFLTSGAPARRW